jgi:serine/threonine-protein kinase
MGWLPEIGDVVLGKYRIGRTLGQGGMGVVFEAVNVATDGHVALKMLKPMSEGGSDRPTRMSREARASAKLRSRFVARVIDFDYTHEGAPVLVMELLEGRDLAAELRRAPVLPIDQALSYVIQACAGVGEAHALGIIHRDLKPGNLFLDTSAGTPLVRVLDFGLSKDLESETGRDLTSPSEALGTLTYMSPEQMRGSKSVGPPTDVWSLGIVLYRSLMGKLPLAEKGYAIATRLLDARPMPRVEREGVPRELAEIIAKALEKDATCRFPDARALGQALRPFVLHPSPTTKQAFDELALAPAPRASLYDAISDTAETRISIPPPSIPPPSIPPPSVPSVIRPKRKRTGLDGLLWNLQKSSRETKIVFAGTMLLLIATIIVAASSR